MKESDLHYPVKSLLESLGYLVYAEVEPRGAYHAGRADVVGYNKPAVALV